MKFSEIKNGRRKRFPIPPRRLPATRDANRLSEHVRADQPEERSEELSASATTKLERQIEPPSPDVDQLDLSHMPDRLRDKFRRILKKYL